MKCLRLILVLAFAGVAAAQTTAPTTLPVTRRATPDRPVPAIHGVLIISVDGLRPDVLLRADAPTIRDLMRHGSFTMWARTTPQSITLPSHVSMLTGVSPSVHGIEWNRDLPLSRPVYPNRPTLFQIASEAGYTTALVAGKSKFSPLAVPGSLDWQWISDKSSSEDSEVAAHAADIVTSSTPEVMFVHFGNVDKAGHRDGWGTDPQLAMVHAVDACIGHVLDALARAHRLDSTMVILSADHGGAGRTHGPDDPRSRTIPWIACGPGIRQDFDLARLGRDYDVQTYDTFATACYVLGIKPKRPVEGKVVTEIFQNDTSPQSTTQPATMRAN